LPRDLRLATHLLFSAPPAVLKCRRLKRGENCSTWAHKPLRAVKGELLPLYPEYATA